MMNPLTPEAINYTWQQLLMRSGADASSFPAAMAYGPAGSAHRPQIVVRACDTKDWQYLLKQGSDRLRLRWLSAPEVVPSGAELPFSDPVPVLFWGKDTERPSSPFAEFDPDGTLLFHADIIAASFFMLSRWEETITKCHDQHGRFPGTASVAYKHGFLHRPIVDEYAIILREWLKALLPQWKPKPPTFSVKLSHDVDNIRRFSDWQVALRTFGGDLLKRRTPERAWQTATDLLAQTIRPDQTTYFQGIRSLAQSSQHHGIGDDAFYFMAASPGGLDNDYDPGSSLIRECILDLQKQGFEIGFHASYQTLDDPERLAREKAHLETIVGHTLRGGRQHFLRFRVPYTWRHWEQAGFEYDSTMSYADHEGFRCGTCYPFRPFDCELNRELNLTEWPLIVMEKTLRNYRGLTPEQAETTILDLARRCEYVGGNFTLLWHNSSLDVEWQQWTETYQRVLSVLAEMRVGVRRAGLPDARRRSPTAKG
jgi:hypothetical protein